MPDITKLSAKAIETLYQKRSEAESAITREFIAVGRGNETMNQIRTQSDPLSLKAVAAFDAFHEVADEIEARKRYQGNTRPIRRSY